MSIKLKTKLSTELKVTEIQTLMQLSSKVSAMRLAIAFSLRKPTDPRYIDGTLVRYDMKKQDGNEYDSFTLFAQDEVVYKVLMEQHMSKKLEDLEFFPEFTSAHLERGINLLYTEIKKTNNKEKFLNDVLEL